MSNQSKSRLLSESEWKVVLGFGVVAGLATFPWWWQFSVWTGCLSAVLAMTVLHMGYASRSIVPLPHLVILVCTTQYGLAPWASYYFPAEDPDYSILNFSQYFAYAGPVSLVISLVWAASSLGLHLAVRKKSQDRASRQLLRELDWLLWGGIAIKLVLGSREFGGLSFLILLLANLRFVGAIGLMLLGAPGWQWRAIVLFLCEINGSVESGMFHELILWTLGFFAVFVYIRRPRMPVFLVWLILLCGGVFVLNDSKWQIRQATWFGDEQILVFGSPIEMSRWNRPLVGGLCLLQSATKAFTGGYTDDSVGNIVMRFNQGWIVDRVLHHVPAGEPYARGETLISGFEASLLPRILAPNKQIAGGQAFMARFADYPLAEETSMNLGFAGEMYANFGYWGGIVGCGLYSLVLGLGVRWVALRAQKSPLWWAVAIYVGHWTLKAETDIGAVLNYIVKATIIIFLVVVFLPAFRAELTGRVQAPLTRRFQRRRLRLKPVSAPNTDN